MARRAIAAEDRVFKQNRMSLSTIWWITRTRKAWFSSRSDPGLLPTDSFVPGGDCRPAAFSLSASPYLREGASFPSAGYCSPARPADPIPQPTTLPKTQTYKSSWPTSASSILPGNPETA